MALIAAVAFAVGQALLDRNPIERAGGLPVPPESLRDRLPDDLDDLVRPGLVLAYVSDGIYHVFIEGIHGHTCPFPSERDPEACFSTAEHTTWSRDGVYRINGSDLLKLPAMSDGTEVLWRGVPESGSIGVRSPGACDRIERFDGYECVDGVAIFKARFDADELADAARQGRMFGFGRLPAGDVRLCPRGRLGSEGVDARGIRVAVGRVVQSANSSEPDPATLWRLMDPEFQEVYGTRDEFASSMHKVSVPRVYRSWGVSHQVIGPRQRMPLLDIQAFCGKEVARSTWMGSAYFPRFDGVSGGAVQMFFIARPDGPKLWFTY